MSLKKIRVLIVDDSAIARELLERGLSLDSEIEVVGKAADVYAARDKIIFLKPDVMTLDVEMPRMDGIEFLKRFMPQYPVPTVVVSAVTTEGSRRALEALDAGALEVVGKPKAGDSAALKNMMAELAVKVKAAAKADLSKLKIKALPKTAPVRRPIPSSLVKGKKKYSRNLIAIGASTGGTAALHQVIEALPAGLPPIVVVQHMPPVFTRMFAEALDKSSELHVVEAEDGIELSEGLVVIAQGDRHLRVIARDGSYYTRLDDSPKVSGHRPSVDVLFSSVAHAAGKLAMGALLTGMGRDGADGLLAMHRAGAFCIAQDEGSSVVWGMPKEAWEAGAADKLVSLESIAGEFLFQLGIKNEEA
ncbi:chemotaxis response regulator protein-glutamate methylesterase [Treponema sp.]